MNTNGKVTEPRSSDCHPVLEAIWIKRSHGGFMDQVEEADVDPEQGIIGNVDRSRRRQVTLLEHESWARMMAELGGEIAPSRRRANLLLRGVSLAHTRGRVLRIGEVRLMIGGETTPCERMDEALPGLEDAMRRDWRGGAFAQILTRGRIHVGDAVEWESDPASQFAEKRKL